MPKATDFGQCWSCISDLEMPGTYVSGNLAIAQAIIRRLITPLGGLLSDPTYGFDLTDLLSAGVTAKQLATAQATATKQAQKDQRIITCPVTLQLTNGVLIVSAKPVTAKGPFSLVFSLASTPTLTAVTLLQITPN